MVVVLYCRRDLTFNYSGTMVLSSRSHIRLLEHRLGDGLVLGDDHVLVGHDCGLVLGHSLLGRYSLSR